MRTFLPYRTPPTSAKPLSAKLIAVLLGVSLIAAACSGSDGSEAVEGIVTNDGGITIKPTDVLEGETEVIDGQDTAQVEIPTAEPAGVDIGGLMPAPDTPFVWFDGEAGSVAGLQGKPTVLNFWASSCAACIAEMPEFEEVFQDIGDQVAFVGMNTGDRRDAADRLATQTGVTYPLAEDLGSDVFRNFGLFVMPTTILLTDTGEIGYVWSGVLTEKELRILIDRHIAPGTYEDV